MISTCGGSSGPLALLDAAAFDVFFTTLPNRFVTQLRAACADRSGILDWGPQAESYVSVCDQLSGFFRPGPAVPPVETRESDGQGRRYVDLDDEAEFSRFLLERRAHGTGEAETSPPWR